MLVKEETLKNGGLHWINLNVEIQVDDQAIETAKSLRQQSLKTTQTGDCFQSWTEWKTATRHVYRNRRWKETHTPEHEEAVAACFWRKGNCRNG